MSPQGRFGALSQGILQGMQMGSLIKESRARGREEKQETQQREEANDERKMNMAMSIMSNKEMPNSAKLQSFNDVFAPLWNKVMGGESKLSKLPQWHDKVGEYIKKAQAIKKDKSFTLRQKRGFLADLQTEAAGDEDLAPMMEEIDVQIQEQTRKDELTAFNIYNDRLTAGDEFTDEETSTLMQIRERSPGAILNVANSLDSRRGGGVSQPADIRKFETVTGTPASLRGTPEYEKMFFEFNEELKAATGGRKQHVGLTPEGLAVIFDPNTGKFETKDINAELLPKNKKLISGEIAGQLGAFDSLINQIGDIKTLAKDSPDLIGPVAGRWNKLKSKFVDNRDFAELDRNIESLITLAYTLSGKQISVQEMRMLKGAILPAVTQPGANFEVALDFAVNWLTSNRDNRINRLRSSGYFVGDVQSQQAGGAEVGVAAPETGQVDLETRKQQLLKRKAELEGGATQ